jgi:hypothetical protein
MKSEKLTKDEHKQLSNYVKEQRNAKKKVMKKVWKGVRFLASQLALKVVEHSVKLLLQAHGIDTDFLEGKWDDFKSWLRGRVSFPL